MTYPCHWFSKQVGLVGDLGSTNDVLIPLGNVGSQRVATQKCSLLLLTPKGNFGTEKISPIAVHNIYSLYESESSESESEDLNEIDIETLMLEQYLALNRNNSQVGVKRLGIEKNIVFEIKSQILRELHENTFYGGKTEDAMEHVQKILEIASLFNTPGISGNDIMLQNFPLILTGTTKR
ncbi:hypothetical protein Tco_0726426 [Tanacetum coccineum]|uniref:DNA-directed RNA polymerase n=1 Tax=Tanacetum coccineum TaxID=301880 RepID=A0ABQ4YG71_9ASTR